MTSPTRSLANASSSRIEGFLSYSHEADEFLNIAEPLHRGLVRAIKLRSNRDIVIFRDREAIAWGDRWRATIDNGLANASVLFVVATADYLASDNCRNEFLDFLNAAKSSGLSGARRLILPIMPVGAPTIFTKDSEDEIAAEIAEIQYELIEDAVMDGEGSPAWKRGLLQLADRFLTVVTEAEAEAESASMRDEAANAEAQAFAAGEETQTKDHVNLAVRPKPAADAIDEMGLGYFDTLESVETDFSELTNLAEQMSVLMVAVTQPMKNLDFSKATTAKSMNVKLAKLAKDMEPNSRAIGETGRALRDKTNDVDVSIRHLVRMAKSVDQPVITDGVRAFLSNAKQSLADVGPVVDQMEELLVSMAPAEATSTLMRKALKPMRMGIVATSDSVRLLQKWGPELLNGPPNWLEDEL